MNYRINLKKIIAKIWKVVRHLRFSRPHINRHNIIVLCYHSVNNEKGLADSLPIDKFRDHISFICQHYNPISVETLVNCLDTNKSLPKRAVLITFDDGYEDNYVNAFPIMKSLQCPFVIFIVSDFIDEKIELIPDSCYGPLTIPQIVEMQNSGLAYFGAHTETHRILSKLENLEKRKEILNSIEYINNLCGYRPLTFAYPNGRIQDYDNICLDLLREAKTSVGFTTTWRTWSHKKKPLEFNRIMISGDDSSTDLDAKMNGDYDYIYWIHFVKGLLNQVKRILN